MRCPSADTDEEPEIVSPSLVVGFVDPNAGDEQADPKEKRSEMPCHKPAQNPAGVASGNLYFEFGPATASTFGMSSLQ